MTRALPLTSTKPAVALVAFGRVGGIGGVCRRRPLGQARLADVGAVIWLFLTFAEVTALF